MFEYTYEQILEGLKEEDITIALKVMMRINVKCAYGHNPELCEASNRLIHLLDTKGTFNNCVVDESITSEERRQMIVDCCRAQKEQLDELLKI